MEWSAGGLSDADYGERALAEAHGEPHRSGGTQQRQHHEVCRRVSYRQILTEEMGDSGFGGTGHGGHHIGGGSGDPPPQRISTPGVCGFVARMAASSFAPSVAVAVVR